MKRESIATGSRAAGFGRTDLLVAVCAVGFLGLISMAALARGPGESRWMVTLSNMKQLTAAWTLYARDNADRLTPNADGGNAGKQQNSLTWAGGWLDWNSQNQDNTNTSLLVEPYGRLPVGSTPHYAGLLGYYTRDARLFVSPNEPVIEAVSGKSIIRSRSLSMNLSMKGSRNSMTGWQQNLANQGYRLYSTMSDLVGVSPASTFVLITEHPDSLNDAHFVIDMQADTAPDRPSSLEAGGANLSFADGHVENWQWRSERFRLPVRGAGIDTTPMNTPEELSDLKRVKTAGVSR